jgi:hypothetical protein
MPKATIEAFRWAGALRGFVPAGGTLATFTIRGISNLFDLPSSPPHLSRHADSYEIVI